MRVWNTYSLPIIIWEQFNKITLLFLKSNILWTQVNITWKQFETSLKLSFDLERHPSPFLHRVWCHCREYSVYNGRESLMKCSQRGAVVYNERIIILVHPVYCSLSPSRHWANSDIILFACAICNVSTATITYVHFDLLCASSVVIWR